MPGLLSSSASPVTTKPIVWRWRRLSPDGCHVACPSRSARASARDHGAGRRQHRAETRGAGSRKHQRARVMGHPVRHAERYARPSLTRPQVAHPTTEAGVNARNHRPRAEAGEQRLDRYAGGWCTYVTGRFPRVLGHDDHSSTLRSACWEPMFHTLLKDLPHYRPCQTHRCRCRLDATAASRFD
jgi:hypothetical protein